MLCFGFWLVSGSKTAEIKVRASQLEMFAIPPQIGPFLHFLLEVPEFTLITLMQMPKYEDLDKIVF